jgi:purine-nucleoside phosphorylase
MRPTIVLGAWEPEVAPLRRMLAAHDARTARQGVVIDVVGVGAIDAATRAARMVAGANARRVIFVGTAGAYAGARRAPPVGAAAVGRELRLVSTAALRGDGYTPAPLVTRALPAPALVRALRARAPALPALVVACPLAITRTLGLGRRIAAATGAALENLEAFAVARAAAAAGAQFAAVLGVANGVGPRAHAEWRAHHEEASRTACAVVYRLLTGRSPEAPRR